MDFVRIKKISLASVVLVSGISCRNNLVSSHQANCKVNNSLEASDLEANVQREVIRAGQMQFQSTLPQLRTHESVAEVRTKKNCRYEFAGH
jgi:hypothetical protein